MPLDPMFLGLTLALDAWFLESVPATVASALAAVRNPLRLALALYVLVYGIGLLIMEVDGRSFVVACIRAACVVALLEAPNYTTHVQDAFLNRWPAEMAAGLNGPRIEANAARQFDVLREAIMRAKALAIMNTSGFGGMVERGVAHVLEFLATAGIGGMWVFWYLPRLLMGIVVCIGPFLVPLWLFNATRGYAMAYSGKLVSLLLLQVSAAVLVRMLLATVTRRMMVMQPTATTDIDTLLSNLAGMAGMMLFAAVVMLTLPAAVTVGSGVGAASNALISRSVAIGGRLLPRS